MAIATDKVKSDKIKALLALKRQNNAELAAHLGITKQSLLNKYSRDSFTAADLIKTAEFLCCELAFIIDERQKIVLDSSDIREAIK